MQWMVGHGLEFHFIIIYIGYQSAIDSLQWDIESNLELDFEGANASMGLNGLCFELIYHVGMIYEGWNDFRFTLIHKGVLVIS